MQLTGKQVLDAEPSVVWKLLMDTETLAKIVPGISKLESNGENSFRSVIIIKLGPVNGSFTGNLQLEDIIEQKSFTLKVQQNSSIGNANSVVKIELTPIGDNQTELKFDGDAKLSGLLASMGQRVTSGVSNTLTKQFFSNLERNCIVSSCLNPKIRD